MQSPPIDGGALLPPGTTTDGDPVLHQAITLLAPPGVLIGYRKIAPGDEFELMPQERPAFAASVIKVQRASGAVRLVARDLLANLGCPNAPLPKTPSGAPLWPDGIVGSLAHDDGVAVAAVARSHDLDALGIDIEPAERLPTELIELITTSQERLSMGHDAFRGRLHFVIKEAVYKAVHPVDRVFLEHHDIEVNFAQRTATVRSGRVVEFCYCVSPRLVALAFLPAGSA
jgi:4'-phosphopantetheinyl transferase EntD